MFDEKINLNNFVLGFFLMNVKIKGFFLFIIIVLFGVFILSYVLLLDERFFSYYYFVIERKIINRK